MKADLHVHTTFSGDSVITPERLIERVREVGLGCVAVVDHNTTAGSFKVKELNPPFLVITGEEIETAEGEIIGLFLKETIPAGLTPEETIKHIHLQAGLACVPHPFDKFRSSAMQEPALERIAALLDCVEVANARTVPLQDLGRPRAFAEKHAKPMAAGSDSHTPEEIGRAYVEIGDFRDAHSFLNVLAAGKISPYKAGAVKCATDLTKRLFRKVMVKK
jgi:predicted metal-dependent phosphoesterase TrpH